jgi:hypothetical protein
LYRERPPLAFIAVLLAVIGGILLAKSHWVGGGIAVAFALIAAVGNYSNKDDSSGLYPW